ncbi:MAG: adenosine deaminase [Chloroflexi bacterium]|nr:MAG: adenosine deaminase [Chloroflexota bacterium]
MVNALAAHIEVHRWPKVDLHCHLEGAIRPTTVLDLYRKNGGVYKNATLEELLPLIQVTGNERSLFDFLAKFKTILPAIKTQLDIMRIAQEVTMDAYNDGVRYLELRYSPHLLRNSTGLDVQDVVDAVTIGVRLAMQQVEIHVEQIFIVPQFAGPQVGEEMLQLALDNRAHGVQALDLAGDIRHIGMEAYTAVFHQAYEAGLGITVHAGEAAPAESVRMAVEDLHATRIGHGIRSIEDENVISLLRERDVLLEVCVTSNLQTRVASSIETHPIRKLIEAGVRVSVNTDDPGISNITLSDEYNLLMQEKDFDFSLFNALNRDALNAAFTNDERKAALQPVFV